MRRVAAIAAALCLCACRTSPDEPHDTDSGTLFECPASEDTSAQIEDACCNGAVSLTIGDGTEPFQERPEGSCHTMVHGPQGGWHMEVSAQVCGTYDRVYLHYEIYDVVTDMRVSDNTYKVALEMVPGSCCGTFDGMYGYLDMTGLRDGDADTPPELICLHDLELRLEVWDPAGQVVATTRRVIGAPHEDDLAICDPGQCPVELEDTEDPADTGVPTASEAQ